MRGNHKPSTFLKQGYWKKSNNKMLSFDTTHTCPMHSRLITAARLGKHWACNNAELKLRAIIVLLRGELKEDLGQTKMSLKAQLQQILSKAQLQWHLNHSAWVKSDHSTQKERESLVSHKKNRNKGLSHDSSVIQRKKDCCENVLAKTKAPFKQTNRWCRAEKKRKNPASRK